MKPEQLGVREIPGPGQEALRTQPEQLRGFVFTVGTRGSADIAFFGLDFRPQQSGTVTRSTDKEVSTT